MDALVIIGLGGIGGSIAEPLCRYLEHSGQIKQVKLIDGDRYEARNSERQQAVAGQNKAEAWAKRLAGSFRNLTVSAVGSFITPDNIRLYLPDNSIIMLGVDNDYKNKNLGLLLMREVFVVSKSVAKTIGCFGIYLDAAPAAVNFYEKLGFALLEGNLSPSESPMFIPMASIP